jgi:hypothetical protein
MVWRFFGKALASTQMVARWRMGFCTCLRLSNCLLSFCRRLNANYDYVRSIALACVMSCQGADIQNPTQVASKQNCYSAGTLTMCEGYLHSCPWPQKQPPKSWSPQTDLTYRLSLVPTYRPLLFQSPNSSREFLRHATTHGCTPVIKMASI